ncbi:BON domain-containing protein [Massilia antarctica]|uniref:BON domain-containing protein n=1 Tax=Massilia antarctica TaxID=2765360 RepID=A0AA48WG23_9BURK|nr:BON domain-containing protein [Massilia antarctica]QPI51668.1 BON domain-containing protein [Massilia antarctica]
MSIAQRFTRTLSGFALLALVACAPTPHREGTGEYIDDSIITGKVKAALVADPELKATQINVDTFKGTVQLSGFVSTPESIPKAVALARKIDGVQSVKNDLLVR